VRVATGVLCAVAVLAATDATTVDTIFNISVDGAIFTSASVTRHAGASPNFAVASYLNQPEFIEVFNTSSVVWSFSQASGTYIADQARHAESAGLTVDTFGAVITSTGTTVYGFSSTGSGVPAWQLPLPGCSSDTGGGKCNVPLELAPFLIACSACVLQEPTPASSRLTVETL
jgi:hypothetical protein